MLSIGRMQTYDFHPQKNGGVERWNQTLARDLPCFLCTGDSDWGEHAALACFRHNTGVCAGTGMTPFKEVFEVEEFQAWGENYLACFQDEPESHSSRLSLLHQKL